MKSFKAFTLMEIMVVVIVIGIMAAFAIPNFQKSIQKAHERDAIVQLRTIHAASQIYKAQKGEYYPGVQLQNLNDINNVLEISLIDNDLDFIYGGDGGPTFTAIVAWPSWANYVFAMQISSVITNPCCLSTSCLSNIPPCS